EIGVLQYGPSPDNLDQEIREEVPSEAHELRLTGLQAGQRYYYAVGNPEVMKYAASTENWFMTTPETGVDTPVRLWVIGDSGQPGKTAWAVRDAMQDWVKANPREGKPYLDQWALLGDNAYRSGSNQQYRFGFFDPYSEILKNIAPWPGYGNHDARRRAFFDIFSLPEQAESGGVASGTEHYYSFDYANVHTIMLDSQDSEREPGSDMLNWLKRDLEAYQGSGRDKGLDWLIVVFHHPPYSKGSHDSDNEADSDGRMVEMREYVLPVLEQYGVDLVLSGHSHGYERSRLIDCHYGDSTQFGEQYIVSNGTEGRDAHFLKPKGASHSGTVYVVAGASSKVDRAAMNHPAMAVSMMKAGSLVIDIEGDRLVARYLSDKAEVADEFSIEKRGDDSWQQYRNPQYVSCR
ncbi:MAG: metallophosphoesterase family protein, partial [Gammaproteobacteria bacterium]|nr:metallophosphoesterase family protein [Gammaproteobacteria bacterium]